jgi:N,N-dimethylformamidase
MTGDGHEQLPIVGYSDPLCVSPGGTVDIMVSTTLDEIKIDIVRLLGAADSTTDPPRLNAVPTPTNGTYPGRRQELRLGSCVRTEPFDGQLTASGLTIAAWVFPTVHGRGLAGVVTRWSAAEQRGVGMFLEPEGDLSLRLDDVVIRTQAPLELGRWTFVAAIVQPDEQPVLIQRPRDQYPGDPSAVRIEVPATGWADHSQGLPIVLGGLIDDRGVVGTFNGKIAAPVIYDRVLGPVDLDRLAGFDPPEGAVGRWRLTTDQASPLLAQDLSGNGHDGTLVNGPMRAVTGPNWTGDSTDFAEVPDQYDALSFHDDDLDDARWQPTARFAVPADLASGAYAAWVRGADGAADWIPFFVSPGPDQTTADIALLIPTLSYLAYANEHSASDNPAVENREFIEAGYQPEDHYVIEVPAIGLYDHHPDGSGVCYSTWRRPMVNMRPHYKMPLIRGAHQFPADLQLIDWLSTEKFEHDTITDHDLHADGVGLLGKYRVIVTGSHPEYWSGQMLDALDSYLRAGGRLMYLGGNGLYWVTTIDPNRPDRIEVRRGRRGTGTWRSEPGEDFHDTTGELGGLWRDRGRPPQRLVGVGMDSQGFDRALPYHRTAAAEDPRAAWIFAGVPDGPIGGCETDRYDVALGTPRHALCIATATGFSDSYQHVVEEVASSDSKQGGTVSDKVRADLVYFEGPNGGGVFSTGSITWCGSLGIDEAVSRITSNVLARFADPAPLAQEDL